jgi:hypothetical protein
LVSIPGSNYYLSYLFGILANYIKFFGDFLAWLKLLLFQEVFYYDIFNNKIAKPIGVQTVNFNLKA